MMQSGQEIVWDDKSVARIWAYYAGNAAVQEQYFSRQAGPRIIRAARPWMDLRRTAVLDYGCGPGYFIEHLLAGATGRIHGLEFSPDSVAAAQRRLAGRPKLGGIVFAHTLPSEYGSDSMDAVTCIEVIEHLDDRHLTQSLEEIRRILRPGGRAFFTTPNEENLEANKTSCPQCATVFHHWQHVRRWSADSLSRTLEAAGLRVLACRPVSFEGSLCQQLRAFIDRAIARPQRLPTLFAVAEKVS